MQPLLVAGVVVGSRPVRCSSAGTGAVIVRPCARVATVGDQFGFPPFELTRCGTACGRTRTRGSPRGRRARGAVAGVPWRPPVTLRCGRAARTPWIRLSGPALRPPPGLSLWTPGGLVLWPPTGCLSSTGPLSSAGPLSSTGTLPSTGTLLPALACRATLPWRPAGILCPAGILGSAGGLLSARTGVFALPWRPLLWLLRLLRLVLWLPGLWGLWGLWGLGLWRPGRLLPRRPGSLRSLRCRLPGWLLSRVALWGAVRPAVRVRLPSPALGRLLRGASLGRLRTTGRAALALRDGSLR